MVVNRPIRFILLVFVCVHPIAVSGMLPTWSKVDTDPTVINADPSLFMANFCGRSCQDGKLVIKDNYCTIPQCFPCDCGLYCSKTGTCCPTVTEVSGQMKGAFQLTDAIQMDDYFHGIHSRIDCKETVDSILGKVLMVASCPQNWTDHEDGIEVTVKCENSTTDSFENFIPYMEENSGLTFANIFCAQCNGFAPMRTKKSNDDVGSADTGAIAPVDPSTGVNGSNNGRDANDTTSSGSIPRRRRKREMGSGADSQITTEKHPVIKSSTIVKGNMNVTHQIHLSNFTNLDFPGADLERGSVSFIPAMAAIMSNNSFTALHAMMPAMMNGSSVRHDVVTPHPNVDNLDGNGTSQNTQAIDSLPETIRHKTKHHDVILKRVKLLIGCAQYQDLYHIENPFEFFNKSKDMKHCSYELKPPQSTCNLTFIKCPNGLAKPASSSPKPKCHKKANKVYENVCHNLPQIQGLQVSKYKNLFCNLCQKKTTYIVSTYNCEPRAVQDDQRPSQQIDILKVKDELNKVVQNSCEQQACDNETLECPAGMVLNMEDSLNPSCVQAIGGITGIGYAINVTFEVVSSSASQDDIINAINESLAVRESSYFINFYNFDDGRQDVDVIGFISAPFSKSRASFEFEIVSTFGQGIPEGAMGSKDTNNVGMLLRSKCLGSEICFAYRVFTRYEAGQLSYSWNNTKSLSFEPVDSPDLTPSLICPTLRLKSASSPRVIDNHVLFMFRYMGVLIKRNWAISLSYQKFKPWICAKEIPSLRVIAMSRQSDLTTTTTTQPAQDSQGFTTFSYGDRNNLTIDRNNTFTSFSTDSYGIFNGNNSQAMNIYNIFSLGFTCFISVIVS